MQQECPPRNFVGDWVASIYMPDGERIDHRLSLVHDGTYAWSSARGGAAQVQRGTWTFAHAERLFTFRHADDGIEGAETLYRLLELPGFEDTGLFMIVRWVALASRNLPVFFYRVTHPG